MLRTMTVGDAARWAGVSPRMLGLMLAGRLIDPTSELDVEVDGLPLDVINSMPGRPGVGCAVAAGAEVPAGGRHREVPETQSPAPGASADEVHPATGEPGGSRGRLQVPRCRAFGVVRHGEVPAARCRGLAGERGVAHKSS